MEAHDIARPALCHAPLTASCVPAKESQVSAVRGLHDRVPLPPLVAKRTSQRVGGQPVRQRQHFSIFSGKTGTQRCCLPPHPRFSCWRHRADLSTGIISTTISALISSQIDIMLRVVCMAISDPSAASIAELEELFPCATHEVTPTTRFVNRLPGELRSRRESKNANDLRCNTSWY